MFVLEFTGPRVWLYIYSVNRSIPAVLSRVATGVGLKNKRRKKGRLAPHILEDYVELDDAADVGTPLGRRLGGPSRRPTSSLRPSSGFPDRQCGPSPSISTIKCSTRHDPNLFLELLRLQAHTLLPKSDMKPDLHKGEVASGCITTSRSYSVVLASLCTPQRSRGCVRRVAHAGVWEGIVYSTGISV